MVTVCSPAQPKPFGHYFPGQWFSGTSFKITLDVGTASASSPTHFPIPEVPSPSRLVHPNA